MKRLNDQELQARITSFIERKSHDFPEIFRDYQPGGRRSDDDRKRSAWWEEGGTIIIPRLRPSF